MKLKTVTTLAVLGLIATLASAQQQGVSKDEIRIGTIQDLSGPLAGFGKQARNGMQLRVDELNEQGNINGRKLKLFVEDSGYDPKKAVLAAQKLVNQEKIFIMAGHMARRRTWRRCRCSSRRTSSTSCRSPRRAKCTSH